MSQSHIQTERSNNNHITEMYMALFEATLTDSFVQVDLSLEQVEDRWMYESMITTQMYDLFIQGHMQANEDLERLGDNKATFQEMWHDAGSITAEYIKQFQNP